MQIDRYAVFGNPIAHSKSPIIHRIFAEQRQQNLRYDKQLVKEDAFVIEADKFFSSGGLGLNITVPFKQQACAYATKLSERALLAGAVNTLIFEKDNTIVGDNTDGVGFIWDFTERLGWTLKNKRVLILGAGGATRGILLPLIEQAPETIHLVNRTKVRAEQVATVFSGHFAIDVNEYSQLNTLAAFDVIINATSASLQAEAPPIPGNCYTASTVCYDLAYGKEDTAFIQWAKSEGMAQCADGLGMLVGQAAESFYLWRSVSVDALPVLVKLRSEL